MVRHEAAKEAGHLDERFFMYREVVDWEKRLWEAGWSVWYMPKSKVVHIGGQSSESTSPDGTPTRPLRSLIYLSATLYWTAVFVMVRKRSAKQRSQRYRMTFRALWGR